MTTFSGEGKKAFLVKGVFDTGLLTLWTGNGDLDWDGLTWRGAGQALAISSTASTTGSRVGGVSITLSGVDPEIIAIAESEPFQRRRVQIFYAVFDDLWRIVGADLWFSGVADSMPSNGDPENPQINMTVESRALELQHARAVYYTSEDQADRHPGDKIFDLVPSLQTKVLQLG